MGKLEPYKPNDRNFPASTLRFLCFVSQPLRKFPADASVARFEGFLGGKSPGHLKMKDNVGVILVVTSQRPE